MLKYVIIGLIAIYFIYVVVKKVKDVKEGKVCNCNCDTCPMKKDNKNAKKSLCKSGK
jgi:hypothetical protein